MTRRRELSSLRHKVELSPLGAKVAASTQPCTPTCKVAPGELFRAPRKVAPPELLWVPTKVAAAWSRAVEALRPPPIETLPEWIERVVRLPEGLSAEPGKVELWPVQVEVAKSIGDDAVERVTWLKSVRSGFTFLVACAVARHVLDDAAPIIVLMPTEADARGIMVDDIEPLFASSPELHGLLPEPARDERGRSTLLQRFYPGGSVKAISSKAARNLRRHTARCVYADEVDAMECIEGDPLKLAERRTLTYRNRKLVAGSSPKVEDTSLICKLYAESDQRIFEVACPQCSHRFELLWRHIEWPPDQPEVAHAVCPECGGVIEERDKPALVASGRWCATHPEITGHHGYRSNALVSTLANCAWGKLAREFIVAKDDSDLLRAFTTTIFAEPWRDAVDDVDDTALAARAEAFDLDDIPPEVLAITVGCDLADDRIEASIVGHTKSGDALVLDHRILYGSPADQRDEVWRELDELLRTRWKHPKGGQLKVDAACVDGGDGEHMDAVLAFCSARLRHRVFATKGVYGPGRPAIARSRGKGRALFILGSDTLKGQIINRLARGSTVRFGRDLGESYFLQLCSERRIVRMSRGRPVVRFERRPGMLAEALDCLALALGAKAALRLDLGTRETELASAQPPAPRELAVVRSPFFDNPRQL